MAHTGTGVTYNPGATKGDTISSKLAWPATESLQLTRNNEFQNHWLEQAGQVTLINSLFTAKDLGRCTSHSLLTNHTHCLLVLFQHTSMEGVPVSANPCWLMACNVF
jgi:hypothetical protein